MSADVKSALRVINLLELLSEPGEELTHTQIVDNLAVPKSSLTPLLQTLVEREYVCKHDVTNTYSLGPAITRLKTFPAYMDFLRNRLRTIIDRLAVETEETALFSVRQGVEVCVVSVAQGSTRTPYQLHDGERLPLEASSAGKVIWANETRTVRLALFHELAGKGGDGISRPAFDQEMKIVARNGIAVMRDRLAIGVTSVSAPVFTQAGRLIGALSVGLLSARYTEVMHAKIALALRQGVRAAQRGGPHFSDRTISYNPT